jgi:hypothetical protein
LEIEKKIKRNSPLAPPGWADSGPSPPLSLSRARSSPPPEAQLGPPPACTHATPTISPAPPVSRAHPRSLATALSLAGEPCLSASSTAPVIRLSAHSPSATTRPVAWPLTRSPARFGTLRPCALCLSHTVATACPSRPVTTVCHHRRRSKASLVLATSPPPSLAAYKKTSPSSPNCPHRPRPPHTPPLSSIELRHRALPLLQ